MVCYYLFTISPKGGHRAAPLVPSLGPCKYFFRWAAASKLRILPSESVWVVAQLTLETDFRQATFIYSDQQFTALRAAFASHTFPDGLHTSRAAVITLDAVKRQYQNEHRKREGFVPDPSRGRSAKVRLSFAKLKLIPLRLILLTIITAGK